MHIKASPGPVGDGRYEFPVGGACGGRGVDIVCAVGVGLHFPGVGFSEEVGKTEEGERDGAGSEARG